MDILTPSQIRRKIIFFFFLLVFFSYVSLFIANFFQFEHSIYNWSLFAGGVIIIISILVYYINIFVSYIKFKNTRLDISSNEINYKTPEGDKKILCDDVEFIRVTFLNKLSIKSKNNLIYIPLSIYKHHGILNDFITDIPRFFENYTKLLSFFFYRILIPILIILHIQSCLLNFVQIKEQSMLPGYHHNDLLLVEKLSTGKITIQMNIPVRINFDIKIPIFYHSFKRGEVVIFKNPHDIEYYSQTDGAKLLIKRIIGLGGDTYNIQNGYIFINDNKLEEDYVYDPGKTFLKKNSQNTGINTLRLPNIIKDLGVEAVYAFQVGIKSSGRVPLNSVFVLGDNRLVSRDSRHNGIGFIPLSLIYGRPLADFKTFRSNN
jgi:signal peptidase I